MHVVLQRYIVLALLLSTILAFGCGAKSSPFVGKYKGVFKGAANSPFKDMGEASYVNLKDGGSFTMMLVAEQSGTWTAEGNTIKASIDRMGSIDIPESDRKTMEFKVSADGKTLTPSEGGSAEDASLIFIKQ